MQDAGLVAEEEVDGWQKNYNFYVPLKGISGDEKSRRLSTAYRSWHEHHR